MSYGLDSVLGRGEPLLEVRQNVIDELDADRQSHQTGSHPRRQLVLSRELGVSRRRRVDDQRAHVADVGHVAVQAQCLDEFLSSLHTTGDLEGDDGTSTTGGVLVRQRLPWAGGQRGVGHGLDLAVCFEPTVHLDRVLHVTLDSQRQGLDPLGDEKRVERRDGRSQVAQQLNPRLEDVGQVGAQRAAHPEVASVDQPVVARVRLIEARVPGRVPGVVEDAPSTMTPAMDVPCPPRYLVAEWTTTSAPHSSGRMRYGVATVLSTMRGTPTSLSLIHI